jgi:hypothetical protein
MNQTKESKKPKKTKFRKVTFMLSKSEIDYLSLCVMLDKTTLNKFIKKSLRTSLEKYQDRVNDYIKSRPEMNQLALFDFDAPPVQTSMLEEYEEFYQGE